MSRWQKFSSSQISKLPKAPGVYVLYVSDKLVYIEQTLNLRKRVAEYLRGQLWHKDVQREDCYVKITFSKTVGDWFIRSLRLSLRLSPPWNKDICSWKDFKGLRDRGEGYLTLPPDFVLDPYADWMIILRDRGKSDNEIAAYLNKCQSQKRWTPNAVHRVLRKYDSYSTEVAA